MISYENEPLSRHTTFAVGGPARYYLVPENAGEIREAVDLAVGKSLPYLILGRGSNLLFPDSGYGGVIIEIGGKIGEVEIVNRTVNAGAGCPLSSLAKRVAQAGLDGFAFAGGIPGTVGGAVVMNAGAYGGEIRDSLREVEVITPEGDTKTLAAKELELGYRHSIFQKNKDVILKAVFEFEPGSADEVLARMKELNERRREKQPLEYASAGSTFKRPEGYFAGALIEEAGLKGYRIGDAQVSEKHAGFIINRGDATASDIAALIRHVQERVKEVSGVSLEPEVKMIGDFEEK